MIEYFLIYLVLISAPASQGRKKKKPILPHIANQYVSHVIKFLLDNQYISSRALVRSDRSADILKGLINLNPSSQIPLRLRCKIPVTYPILLTICEQIDILYSRKHQYRLRLALRAAVCLGYALSLRPQEYLVTRSAVTLRRQANSSLCFFWFPNDPKPYNVCSPDLFPLGVSPCDFTMFLDFNKNHQHGDSGPRSMSAAPSDAPLCCLHTLFLYIMECPPTPNTPLLSGVDPDFSVTVDTIRDILYATATVLNLDPTRLVPHSFRCAALSQMLPFDIFSDLDFQVQGRWSTLTGLRPYAHDSLAHARKINVALYSFEALPTDMIRLHYSAKAPL